VKAGLKLNMHFGTCSLHSLIMEESNKTNRKGNATSEEQI